MVLHFALEAGEALCESWSAVGHILIAQNLVIIAKIIVLTRSSALLSAHIIFFNCTF